MKNADIDLIVFSWTLETFQHEINNCSKGKSEEFINGMNYAIYSLYEIMKEEDFKELYRQTKEQMKARIICVDNN